MDTLAIKVFLISLLVIVVAKAASLQNKNSHAVASLGGSRNYFIAHACERTILTMTCQRNMNIQLVHATYGRQNMRHCNNGRHADATMWSNRCMAPVRRTTAVVAEMCNGRQTCVIPVVNMLFSDPCPTTFKYLEIYYICVQA